MLIGDVRRGAPGAGGVVNPAAVVAASVCAGLLALQIVADGFGAVSGTGFEGPLHSLVGDYLAAPKSATLPWVALGLAMVGLTHRRRLVALSVAGSLDVALGLARVWRGGALTAGNGPLFVLTGLALLAWLRWSGAERADALRGIGWGALLVVASKAADTWLQITGVARPQVLDEYLLVADRALGQPAWLLNRAMIDAGPIVAGVLHWIYIELPVAAVVVAIYQLRDATTRGWPGHHLMRTFLVLGVIGPLIYLAFPVVGPIFAFGDPAAGLDPNAWSQLPAADLTPRPIRFAATVPRNCMPSMHTAWALAVFLHSRGGPRWLRWGGAVWLTGTVVATLGFGYHYGADLIAGAVLCLTVEAALRNPGRRGPTRARLVTGGAALLVALLLCYRYLAVPMAQLPLLFGPLLILLLGLYGAAFEAAGRQR